TVSLSANPCHILPRKLLSCCLNLWTSLVWAIYPLTTSALPICSVPTKPDLSGSGPGLPDALSGRSPLPCDLLSSPDDPLCGPLPGEGGLSLFGVNPR